MSDSIKNLTHYADMLAIPFFACLIVYFYRMKRKTKLEYFLLLFAVGGFMFDCLSAYLFFHPFV